jgi:CrcB protein
MRKRIIRIETWLGSALFQNQTMVKFLIISLGAVLGANTRYWVADWAAQRFGASFPYGTLIINLSGSLILGYFMAVFTSGSFLIDPNWRLFVAIGFLGSYTTFSTYTLESLTLMQSGQVWMGFLNLIGSSLLGGLAAAIGMALGRMT